MSTIAEKLNKLNTIKQNIKDAIIAKGQTVGDVFDTYADAISKISGGGGDLPEIFDTDPLTFVRVDNLGVEGGVSIINQGVTNTKTFEYNKNDTGWATYTVGDEIPMNYGDKVQFRSNSTAAMSTSATNYRYFKTRGLYNCGGTLASLINNFVTTKLRNYCFTRLFQYCNIINGPVLPWTSIADFCYANMFYGCTSLVNAPALPATTLASTCYQYMFYGCTSLVNAPALPATTLVGNCYYGMFFSCTSLVNAPELHATTLASDCYYSMFNGCIKLKEIYCNAIYRSGTTEITTSISNNWLSGVPNTSDCIFHKNPDWSGPTSRGVNTIPSSWQIVDWIQ